uniref:Putative bifunctional DNA primase/polymerase n=1 Tax=viral metagenome TaxID=1070528 RepID=A0A6M3JPE2_9ZZZZ
MIGAVLEYYDMGLCVIPMRSETKSPYLTTWTEYQTKMPSRESVIKWWQTWPDALIGLVCGDISGVCLLDADSEGAKTELYKIVPELSKPHTSTPRPGWHWYFKCPKNLRCKDGFIEKADIKANGGLAIIPPSKRNGIAYKFIDEDFDFRSLAELPKQILELLNNSTSMYSSTYCKNDASDDVYQCLPMSTDVYFDEPGRDKTLFHLAHHLVKGKMPEGNIKQFLHFFASNCNPPFTPKETEAKIKSALSRAENQERNITQEIRDYALSTNGYFLSTDVQNCLLLSTRNEKKLCSKALSGLVDERIIERFGNKNGMFRRIENEAPDIDIFNVKPEFIKLKFPLGLHDYFNAKPKNIAIIAGTQDSGKTAFCLRFAAMNMNRGMPIRYMTSEMGDDELVDRLKDFEDIPIDDWSGVNFKEVSSNFHDYILPDGINIIDYFEITDSFFLIGGDLKKIYDKLRKGFAIVALQKDFKSDLGRGGTFSAEKPRLYISITGNPPEGGIAKIVKCKNWANKRINPNGRVCHFKIRNGNEIRQVTQWDYPQTNSSKRT